MRRPSELTTSQLEAILENVHNLGISHVTEEDVLSVFWAALVAGFVFVPADWLDSVYRTEGFESLLTEEDIVFGISARPQTENKNASKTTISKLAHYLTH